MCRNSKNAFTLVELLVVIGIISILIAILLPVLSRAQDAARGAACLANLRSISQAAQIYATENRGQLPFGFYWNDLDPQTGLSPSGGFKGWVSWYTLLNRTLNPKGGYDGTNALTNGGASRMGITLSRVFRCPAAGEFNQQVHYYNHGVAMPHLTLELQFPAIIPASAPPAKTPIRTGARFTDLYNDNILFWDTPLLAGADSRTGLPFFHVAGEAGSANSVLPVSFIDGQQLRSPNITEFRFRDDIDRFAGLAENELRGPGQTVYFATDKLIAGQTAVPGLTSANSDVGGRNMLNQMIGNLRFRHNRQTTCNIAFADGSVRGLRLNKSRVIPVVGGDETYETEVTRRMVMIKWPTGISPSGTYSAK